MNRSPAVFLVLAAMLGGCGGGSLSSTASTSVPASTQTEQPIATAASPSPSSAAALTYLAFGDSWPYGAHCNGCRPFTVLLESGFAAATGMTIFFRNDVSNGGTAQGLAGQIKSLAATRAHIAAADIIVIAIGGNAGLIETLGADFGATKGVAITAMYHDMQCEVAVAHHAVCVDLGHALNGPDLLIPNDVNSQATMQAVADAILATGLQELAK